MNFKIIENWLSQHQINTEQKGPVNVKERDHYKKILDAIKTLAS